MKISERIQETNEEVDKMVGTPGKYGFYLVGAGLAVIGYDRPKLATGLALVIAGLGLVANGMISKLLKALGMS